MNLAVSGSHHNGPSVEPGVSVARVCCSGAMLRVNICCSLMIAGMLAATVRHCPCITSTMISNTQNTISLELKARFFIQFTSSSRSLVEHHRRCSVSRQHVTRYHDRHWAIQIIILVILAYCAKRLPFRK